jgi:hypothetical protein
VWRRTDYLGEQVMKYLTIILFLILFSSTMEANRGISSSSELTVLNIHLTHGFDQSTVNYYVDSLNIFRGHPFSNPVIGFAQSSALWVTKGQHKFTIQVDALQKDTILNIRDTLYLQIAFFQGAIHFNINPRRPMYM